MNNIKILFVFIGLQMYFLNSFSQDSISKNKNIEFQIKGTLLPVFIGYNYIGAVGFRWNKTNEINIGYKKLEYMLFGYVYGYQSLFLIDYNYFVNSNNDVYISPYIKLRNMHFSDYDGDAHLNYDEKSIGLGLTYGKYLYLNKKKRLFLNYFVGGGWFIPINSHGYYSSWLNNTREGYQPDLIFRSIDLRLGVLLGIKFKK